MARYAYQGTYKDQNGKVVTSGTISVFLTGTTTAASVYVASSGGSPVASVTSDSTDGHFIFYVDDADYAAHQLFAITLSKSGYLSKTYSNLDIFKVYHTDIITKGPYVDIRAFGAVGDGVTDDTAAIQSAIDSTYARNNRTVLIPHGQYRINGTLTLTQGVMLVALGSQGSTQQYGTTFIHYSTGNLFVWDGSGASNSGTGGGLKNCLILKASGYTGGDAIKLLATDDNHRPGEMVFENVLVYGTGTGLWARGFNIDGTACTTAGSKGVRTAVMHKVRVADCTTTDEYIVVNQGVHVSGTHVQIDTGHGTGTCGMTVKGDSDNISFSNLVLNGNLKINDNATHVNLHGRISALEVVGTSVIGTAAISVGSQILNASKSFKVAASNLKPAFLGKRITTVSNVTGDASVYAVLYDSEAYDRNGDFDPATGKFTANVAGIYRFLGTVALSDLGASHTRADVTIDHKNSTGSTLGSYAVVCNPCAVSVTGSASVPVEVSLEMAKGDTANLTASVSGGTLTVDVYGTASTIYTYFAGELQ